LIIRAQHYAHTASPPFVRGGRGGHVAKSTAPQEPNANLRTVYSVLSPLPANRRVVRVRSPKDSPRFLHTCSTAHDSARPLPPPLRKGGRGGRVAKSTAPREPNSKLSTEYSALCTPRVHNGPPVRAHHTRLRLAAKQRLNSSRLYVRSQFQFSPRRTTPTIPN
jgi:hypothetical protein